MKPADKAQYIRLAYWVAAAIVVIWFLIKIYHTVLVFALALFISYLLNPLINHLAGLPIRRPIKRMGAIIVVFTLLVMLVVTAMALMVPVIVEQSANLIQEIPDQISRSQEAITSFSEHYKRLRIPEKFAQGIDAFLALEVRQVGELTALAFNALGNLLATTLAWFFYLISSFIVSAFLLLSYNEIKARCFAWIPLPFQDDVQYALGQMHTIFGGFMKGTLMLSILQWILTILVLLLVGLFGTPFNYVLITGIIAGITYAIPIIGIFVSAVIGGVLAYVQTGSLTYALIIAGLVMLVNKMIDQFVVPKVMSDAVGVSPLFIIFAAFAGAELLGVWGMLLGVPLAAMVKVVVTLAHSRFMRETGQSEYATIGERELGGAKVT